MQWSFQWRDFEVNCAKTDVSILTSHRSLCCHLHRPLSCECVCLKDERLCIWDSILSDASAAHWVPVTLYDLSSLCINAIFFCYCSLLWTFAIILADNNDDSYTCLHANFIDAS